MIHPALRFAIWYIFEIALMLIAMVGIIIFPLRHAEDLEKKQAAQGGGLRR